MTTTSFDSILPDTISSASHQGAVWPVQDCSRAAVSRPEASLVSTTSELAQNDLLAYLLLHLPNLELMPTQFPIVYVLALLPVLLRNNILHLAHKTPASFTDSFARFLKSILRSTSEIRFHPTGRHKLRRRSSHVVAGNNQLLGAIPAADHTICRFDQRVR